MVRVNILNPRNLADQHLIAEYNELLMLLAYIKEHSAVDDVPDSYVLGKGHMKFFKNKVKYLKQRHEKIVEEMKRRGFKPQKRFSLKGIKRSLLNGWRASAEDKNKIKKRLIERIKLKPEFYRYYGNHKSKNYFIALIRNSN